MDCVTGWRRLVGSPKLQIIFHKSATQYRSLLRKRPIEIRDPMSLRYPVRVYVTIDIQCVASRCGRAHTMCCVRENRYTMCRDNRYTMCEHIQCVASRCGRAHIDKIRFGIGEKSAGFLRTTRFEQFPEILIRVER